MSDPQSQEEIDRLMRELAGAVAAEKPAASAPSTGVRLPLEPMPASSGPPRPAASIEVLNDVRVQLRVELGAARLQVQDVLKLGAGAVVPLDRLAGEPVNVFLNDRLVARGEVLVVDDNFAVRILEVVASPPPRPPA
jgi:flagellar motor switch protein FliN/FliY